MKTIFVMSVFPILIYGLIMIYIIPVFEQVAKHLIP